MGDRPPRIPRTAYAAVRLQSASDSLGRAFAAFDRDDPAALRRYLVDVRMVLALVVDELPAPVHVIRRDEDDGHAD